MPKRKEPELTPKEQFKRFVETAREHEVDETGEQFEQVFKRITRHAHIAPKECLENPENGEKPND